jgi:hypothetical protein
MRTGPPSRALVLAACLAATAASAVELGTLFSSAEERDRLDRIRRGEPANPSAGHEASRTPTVTGFVKRSDGRNTVWIDGVAIAVGRRESDQLLEPPATPSQPDKLRIERKKPR